ncbi:MAG: hypothetical protein MJ247_00270 [Alphaproteobacteria bacterium]|nr:hypothetical protein [Alphaproteobacteria bacterium]
MSEILESNYSPINFDLSFLNGNSRFIENLIIKENLNLPILSQKKTKKTFKDKIFQEQLLKRKAKKILPYSRAFSKSKTEYAIGFVKFFFALFVFTILFYAIVTNIIL